MSHITQEPSKEEFALGSFLSAMQESNLNGRAMRAAMLKALGMDGAALAQPEPVNAQLLAALDEALVHVAHMGHGTPQHMCPEGLTLFDADGVEVRLPDGRVVHAGRTPAYLRKNALAAANGWQPHSDDIAVDAMAAAMKEKLRLAREKGRGGWETCSQQDLSRLLREHVDKGDPRDVANFCAFLYALGFGIAQPEPVEPLEKRNLEGLGMSSTYFRGLGWNEAIDAMAAALAQPEPVEPSDTEFFIGVCEGLDEIKRRDAAFEAVRKKLVKLPRYSFHIHNGNVRRVEETSGNWIEFDIAHRLFDPVAVDAALLPKAPLPDHEIVTMYAECPNSDAEMIEFARAIEAAHGITRAAAKGGAL